MANKEDEYKKLRSYLNKVIRGKNTEAILRSVSSGSTHLINNVEAVNDSLYIVSAKDQYLDSRLGDKGVVRPAEVGLSDEVFRDIGIEITNRKQVRDLIHQLLRILYGEIFTRATSASQEVENFALEEGDNLIISFDGQESFEISFTASQFSNISSATAQEVADAITKSLRKIGVKGSAFTQLDGENLKVVLMSSTDGPSSSVTVLGGKAQNALKFDEIRPTSGEASTQWTLTQESGGIIRATWTGGADPSLGVVKVGDYVNIYGSAFAIENRGTFTIVKAQGGTIGKAYVEYVNPNGITQGGCSINPSINLTPALCSAAGGIWNAPVAQGTEDAILFFNPKIKKLISKQNYAGAFQTSSRTLEVFVPATTKVVRRNRVGAAHVYESGPSNEGQPGPYTYDTEKGYVIGEQSALTTEELDVNSDSILFVDDSSDFPDEQGNLVIGLGTSHEEGPVPYISKASEKALRINPSYKFKNKHPIGTDVALIAQNSPANPDKDGTDYPFYLTDSVAGRIYAEDLINEITATGIVVIIYILYPSDVGLGKAGDQENSEKYYIWGTEEDL